MRLFSKEFISSETYNQNEVLFEILMVFQMICSCQGYGRVIQNGEGGKHLLYKAQQYECCRNQAIEDVNELLNHSFVKQNRVYSDTLKLVNIYLSNHAIDKAVNLLKGFGSYLEGSNPDHIINLMHSFDWLAQIDEIQHYGCAAK